MNILVLQLCRLGDILQTTPMLRNLRRTHPGAHITLVTHDLFGHVPVPETLFDRWIPFPANDIGAALLRSPSDWPRQVKRLQALTDDLSREPFDLTLNLTHSDLSGLLSAAIPSREVRGGLVAPDRTRVVHGSWMTYFWASQTCRELGCFNLVDIHNWAAGVAGDRAGLEIAVSPADRDRMQAWLDGRGVANRPLIAVQLGASDERKRWPPERFAEALGSVPGELGDVVLVGSREERELAERFQAQAASAPHDAVGATTIPELAALLERCRLLVTNDTGTMHVATAVGTRILDLSTGPVFVHETGPYGDGHLVVEPTIDCFPCAAGSTCSHVACRDWIDPTDVAGLVAYALDAGPLPRPDRARLLRGRFEPSGRVTYDAIWPLHPSRSDVLRRALATVWESTLPVPAPATPSETPSGPPDPFGASHDPNAWDAGALEAMSSDCAAASALAGRIGRVSGVEQVEMSASLSRLLDDLYRRAQLAPEIKPFVSYLKVSLDSVTERDVTAVAGIYRSELSEAAGRARLLARALTGHDDVRRRSA